MKNILLKTLSVGILSLAVLTGCDKDKYAEINTDPSTVGTGNVLSLFTHGYLQFQPADYVLWFYNGNYTSTFVQSFIPGSYTDRFNLIAETGGCGSQAIAVLRYKREIDDLVSRMSKEEGAKYKNIQAIISTLVVYLGIFDTDVYGSMPYTEAAMARYGGTLTPAYDNQQKLFETWLSELNSAIGTLTTATDQISLGNNDFVYGGDVSKWIKFANGLKLKIAVRLLHQDKAQALKIASEVGANDDYVMGAGDSFIYNKGLVGRGNADYVYQTGNDVSLGSASKNVIDFMKRNRDPRMLVMFTKNHFNAEVIDAFFEAQKNAEDAGTTSPEIPKYILDNVNYTTDASGLKRFVSWKGEGEPWVRYVGCPVGLQISDNPEYTKENNYFDSNKWKVNIDGNEKTYSPRSYFNEELVRGRVDFTYPTRPGVTKTDTEDVPWYGMTLSGGEVNFYLAEFKTLGASLPKSASDYFQAGLTASVQEYNRLAILNKIPYYNQDRCYDEYEKPIAFENNDELGSMISAMLEHPDYQLTGNKSDDLEKIYIQEYLHFMYEPIDQFVTVRRSGVPKVGSSLIPWVEILPSAQIPRRFYVTEPKDNDTMRENKLAAYAEEGFTTSDGQSPATLNSERVWYDKGAPNYGEGPNY